MSIYFRMFEHLLPRARVWQLKVDTQLRNFFVALTRTPSDARDYIDGVQADEFPQTTTQLDAWESQWGHFSNAGLTEQERRDRLDADWSSDGGQSPRYLQDTLQANGFDVYVHEWWVLPAGNPPVAKNPFTYLSDGPSSSTGLDEPIMELDEDPEALLDQTSENIGYLLVNKVLVAFTTELGLDSPELELDEEIALLDQLGSSGFSRVSYPIPVDPNEWPYILYIGGETFPGLATVPIARREEFENLCLKICPGQQYLGMLVQYS